MSAFQIRLLADVSKLCQALFSRRILLVREQQLVSEKTKEDIRLLIMELDGLRSLDPFPADTEVDEAPLQQLQTDLANPDHDPLAGQAVIMNWVKAFRPSSMVARDAATPEVTTSPLNQRMIDSLHQLRTAIDKSRVRLLRAQDRYDRKAYTASRNAFTLTRSVYAERLRLGQIDCTNAQVAKIEQQFTPAVETATGAFFCKEN